MDDFQRFFWGYIHVDGEAFALRFTVSWANLDVNALFVIVRAYFHDNDANDVIVVSQVVFIINFVKI